VSTLSLSLFLSLSLSPMCVKYICMYALGLNQRLHFGATRTEYVGWFRDIAYSFVIPASVIKHSQSRLDETKAFSRNHANTVLFNRELRRGIAVKLRAKVARLFGTIMSQYVSDSSGKRLLEYVHIMLYECVLRFIIPKPECRTLELLPVRALYLPHICGCSTSNTAEHGIARATAAFRVKLNRLLDSSFLGEIQCQASCSQLKSYCNFVKSYC